LPAREIIVFYNRFIKCKKWRRGTFDFFGCLGVSRLVQFILLKKKFLKNILKKHLTNTYDGGIFPRKINAAAVAVGKGVHYEIGIEYRRQGCHNRGGGFCIGASS